MTNYSKGRAFEYRVRRYLEGKGFVVFRTAGSHSPADLIALRAGEVWLVQCKATTGGYLSRVARLGFVEVANELGVVPMLAFKESRKIALRQVKAEG